MHNLPGIGATESESFHGLPSYSAVAETLPIATPLRADIGEWIGVVIFLVITAVSYLSQLSQKAGQPAPRRAPPRPDGGARDAAEEVRQFLERANQQRKTEAERRPIVPAEVVKSETESDRSSRRPPAWARESVAESRTESNSPSVLRGESVAEHVQQHIERDPLPHHVPSVDQADEQMEAHLHQVFDHRLGSIGTARPIPIRDGTDEPIGQRTARTDASEDPAEAPRSNPLAAEIAGMLRNPQQIRQAVILGEILRRRDDLLN